VRRTPSTSQNSSDEPSWSLIRLVSRRDDEEQADASASATSTVPAHMPPEISSSSSGSCALARDAERLEADRQRLDERDDAADRSAGAAPVALRTESSGID
jgi:hypothetical protein